jgi:hypothetical protein
MATPVAFRTAVIASVLAMLAWSGEAAQDQAVSIVATSPGTLTLGEPIRAAMTVTNGLRESVFVDFGADFVGNLSLSITYPDGSRAAKLVPRSGGLRAIGRVSIAPGGRYTHEILLSDWASFSQPGIYRVSIQPMVRAVTASWHPVEMPATNLLISIAPRDEAALRSTCEQLATLILTTDDASRRISAARALAAVQDPIAVEAIARVMRDSDKSDGVLIEALARIGSQDALNVLEHAAASSNEERSALARDTLKRRQSGARDAIVIDAVR